MQLLGQELKGQGHPHGGLVTIDFLAPIQNFALLIVAFSNGDFTTYSSGAGVIEYETWNTFDAFAPINQTGALTGENSNILYSGVSVNPGTVATQTFIVRPT